MLKILANWIWLLLFGALVFGFILGGLSASKEIPAQQHAQRADTAQGGAEPQPTAISEPHTEQDTAKGGDKKEPHGSTVFGWLSNFFEVKLTDLLIAIFTVVLAVKTSGLFRETAGLRSAADRQAIDMQESIKSATMAAKAAQTSADASLAAERARFFIVIHELNIGEILNAFAVDGEAIFRIVGRSTQPAISYSFRNYGKTPGIMKELTIGMRINSNPVEPVFSFTTSSFPESMIAAGAASPARWSQYESPLDRVQAKTMSANQAHLWFYGYLDYEDVFGEPQRHQFYFRTVVREGECVLQPFGFKTHNEST